MGGCCKVWECGVQQQHPTTSSPNVVVCSKVVPGVGNSVCMPGKPGDARQRRIRVCRCHEWHAVMNGRLSQTVPVHTKPNGRGWQRRSPTAPFGAMPRLNRWESARVRGVKSPAGAAGGGMARQHQFTVRTPEESRNPVVAGRRVRGPQVGGCSVHRVVVECGQGRWFRRARVSRYRPEVVRQTQK